MVNYGRKSVDIQDLDESASQSSAANRMKSLLAAQRAPRSPKFLISALKKKRGKKHGISDNSG